MQTPRSTTAAKSRATGFLRIAVSGALLAALLAFAPIGDLLARMKAVSPILWLAVLAGFLLGHAFSAAKWRWVIGGGISYPRALKAHFAGLAANIALPGVAGGELFLRNGRIDILGAAASVLEEAGVKLTQEEGGVRAKRVENRCRSVNIVTQPYPGFFTDLQAQFMAMMTVADGVSVIKETIFENRFMHAPELARMGAQISVDGQIATVRGVKRLKGAPVMATDLRASMSLVLAGLGAEGQTIINRVYHLDRGFERLEEKLSHCGALIERVKGEG